MKLKIIVLVFMVLTLFFGCSDNSGKDNSDKNTVINIPSSTSDYSYVVQSSCMGCHQMKGNTYGPSIEDIAAKHKNTNINELISVVKFGRKKTELKWGSAPKPSSQYSETDIKKAIEWMMNNPEL